MVIIAVDRLAAFYKSFINSLSIVLADPHSVKTIVLIGDININILPDKSINCYKVT